MFAYDEITERSREFWIDRAMKDELYDKTPSTCCCCGKDFDEDKEGADIHAVTEDGPVCSESCCTHLMED